MRTASNRSKGGGETMTLDEIKTAIKEGRYRLSDVFGDDEISKDPSVLRIVRGETQAEYEHRTRTDKKFDEERAKWEKEKKDLQTKLDAADQEGPEIRGSRKAQGHHLPAET